MASKCGLFRSILLLVVVSSLLVGEVQCRKRLVMGRKTITRTHYKEPAIPAWATVTLVGLGLVLAGGLLYIVLHKIYLHDEKTYTRYAKTYSDETPA